MENLNINHLLNREENAKKMKEILSHFELNKADLLLKKGIYVYGDPGSGKTTFVMDILKELNYDVIKYDAGDIRNKSVIDTITKEDLLNLIDSKKTNQQIAIILNCSKSNVCRLLKYHNLSRQNNTTHYKKYCNKVRRLTEKNYVKYQNIINPSNYPRTLCGVEDGYQIDHKLSVRFCYDNNISEEVCSSVDNLQMLEWFKNLNKRYLNNFEENYVSCKCTNCELDSGYDDRGPIK
jgi:hypothetical protein